MFSNTDVRNPAVNVFISWNGEPTLRSTREIFWAYSTSSKRFTKIFQKRTETQAGFDFFPQNYTVCQIIVKHLSVLQHISSCANTNTRSLLKRLHKLLNLTFNPLTLVYSFSAHAGQHDGIVVHVTWSAARRLVGCVSRAHFSVYKIMVVCVFLLLYGSVWMQAVH